MEGSTVFGQILFQFNEEYVKKKIPALKLIYLKAKLEVFKTSTKLFPFAYASISQNVTQNIYLVLHNLIEITQMTSLLWYLSDLNNKLGKFINFWRVIGYIRIDNTCITFYQISTCFYFFSSMILFFLFLLLFFYYLSVVMKKEKSLVKLFLSKFIMILSSYMYLPLLCFFTIVVKNYFTQNQEIIEYNLNNQQVEYLGVYTLGIFAFIIIYGTGYIYFTLCYENRHFYKKFNFFSRAHSKVEEIRIQFFTVICVLYSLFGIYYQSAFRGLFGIGTLILSMLYLKLLPFYHAHQNSIHVSNFFLISFFSLCFEIGYISNNYNYTFFLVVFISPFLYGIIYFQSLTYINDLTNSNSLTSVFEFEKGMRNKIFSTNKVTYTEIISDFSDFYTDKKFKKSRFLLIWLSNFCYYYGKDDTLSRIKLGLVVNDDINLETDYQIFRLREKLKDSELEYHEDIDYLNFFNKFQKVKSVDRDLCLKILEFITKFNLSNDLEDLTKDLIPKIAELLHKVLKGYENIVTLYPKSVVAFDLYHKILDEFLDQTEKSMHMLRKKQTIKSIHGDNLKSISYFEEGNGLLIVNGGVKDFSIITFANEAAGVILNQPTSSLIGTSISNYVPYPFNLNHNQHMLSFLFTCNSAHIKLPISLFLQSSKGFLIECYIQVKCSALDSYPFFMVLLKEKSTTREIAIISENGVILNCSQKFGKVLGCDRDVRNYFLDEFLDGAEFEKLPKNRPLILHKMGVTVGIVKSFKIIKNNIQNIVYLITDPQSIEKWIKGKIDKNIQFDKNKKLENEGHLITQKGDFTEKIENSLILKDKRRGSTLRDQIKIRELENKSIKSQIESTQISLSKSVAFIKVLRLLRRFSQISFFVFFVVISLQFVIVLLISLDFRLYSVDFITNLGEIALNTSQISVISRGLYLKNENPMPQNNEIGTLFNLSQNLITLKYNFLNFLQESDCPDINSDTLYYSPSENTLKNLPILIILQIFIDDINSYSESQNSTLALESLILNTLIFSDHLLKMLEKLITCELAKVNQLTEKIWTISLVNTLISGICCALMVYIMHLIQLQYFIIFGLFCELFTKYQKRLWSKFSEKLKNIFHADIPNEKLLFKHEKTKNEYGMIKKIKYLLMFTLWAIVITGFYIIVFEYVEPTLNFYIKLQGDTLKNDFIGRIQIYKLNFWVREKAILSQNFSLTSVYPNMDLFENINVEIRNAQNELKKIQNFYQGKKFFDSISSSNYQLMFFSIHEISGGLYGLANDILLDSYEINSNISSDILYNFQLKVNYFQQNWKITSNPNDINQKILNIEKNATLYSSVYIIVSFVLFTAVFNFMIFRLRKNIKNIQKFGEIIPLHHNEKAITSSI